MAPELLSLLLLLLLLFQSWWCVVSCVHLATGTIEQWGKNVTPAVVEVEMLSMSPFKRWFFLRFLEEKDRERSGAGGSVSLPNHWPLKCLAHKPQLRWTQMISGLMICNVGVSGKWDIPACRALQPRSIKNHTCLLYVSTRHILAHRN